MSRPMILDLFCGAGGCSVGYELAGFQPVGIDIVRQPRYPFEFIQADALMFLRNLIDSEHILQGEGYAARDGEGASGSCGYTLSDFLAIHASPPCQAYSRMSRAVKTSAPKLIEPLRRLLEEAAIPYVIENVEGSELRGNVVLLCGTMFGLRLRRHRLFELGIDRLVMVPPCQCRGGVASGRLVGQMLSGKVAPGRKPRSGISETERPALFGVPWMTPMEARQAIPPAYTEFLGRQLLAIVGEDA